MNSSSDVSRGVAKKRTKPTPFGLLYAVLRGWSILSLITLGVLLLHTSDAPRFFGRYSTRYIVSLGIVGTSALLAVVATVLVRFGKWPSSRRSLPFPREISALITATGIAFAAAFWWRFGSGTVIGTALFRAYIVWLAVGSVLAVQIFLGSAQRTLGKRWWWIGLITIVVTMLLLTARYIGKVPPSRFFDEPWDVNHAWSIYYTRRFYTLMFPPYDPTLMALASGWNIPAGFWMGVVGVGLEQARLFYLLIGGWAALPFVYLLANRLYGRVAALLALALAAFQPLMHTYARPDNFLVLTTSVALYAFFRARQSDQKRWHMVVGFCAIAGYEGHPYGLAFGAAFGVFYWLELVIALARSAPWKPYAQNLIYFGIGLIAFLPVFFLVHIAISPDPAATLSALFERHGEETRHAGDRSFVERVLVISKEVYGQYLSSSILVVSLGLFGAIAGLRRCLADELRLVALWGLSWLLWALMLAHYAPYYNLFFMPYVSILGGAFLAQLSGALYMRTPRLTASAATLLVAVLMLSAVHTDQTVRHTRGQSADDFIAIGRELETLFPPQTPIAGWQAYYLGMPERANFISTENFIYHGPAENWATSETPLPDVIVLTKGIDDAHEVLWDYMRAREMSLAYCFPMGVFGKEARVYAVPKLLPENAPLNCSAE